MRFFSKFIKICLYLYINLVRLFRLTELYQPTYNPKDLYFFSNRLKRRSCDDRISTIDENVDFNIVYSYLDIGSQLGYFVFKLNDIGKLGVAHGIEMDEVCCSYANALAYLNNKKKIFFMNAKLDSSFVSKIPVYDMISFLSVFHHMVHFEGFQTADNIMRQLYRKCNSYFIFETGQFDEKGYYWNESLSFMGDSPEKWIKDYLVSIGYRDAKLVGRFGTHLSDKKRALFICSK